MIKAYDVLVGNWRPAEDIFESALHLFKPPDKQFLIHLIQTYDGNKIDEGYFYNITVSSSCGIVGGKIEINFMLRNGDLLKIINDVKFWKYKND